MAPHLAPKPCGVGVSRGEATMSVRPGVRAGRGAALQSREILFQVLVGLAGEGVSHGWRLNQGDLRPRVSLANHPALAFAIGTSDRQHDEQGIRCGHVNNLV